MDGLGVKIGIKQNCIVKANDCNRVSFLLSRRRMEVKVADVYLSAVGIGLILD